MSSPLGGNIYFSGYVEMRALLTHFFDPSRIIIGNDWSRLSEHLGGHLVNRHINEEIAFPRCLDLGDRGSARVLVAQGIAYVA